VRNKEMTDAGWKFYLLWKEILKEERQKSNMQVGLYVNYDKAKIIIDKILPEYIGVPGSGCFGESMVSKQDVLYVLAELAEKKEI